MSTMSGEQVRESVSRWPGPLAIHPDREVAFDEWAVDRRAWIDAALIQHGALLFKRCSIDSPEAFRSVATALCGSLVEYMYRSSPRTSVAGNVYTATEYRSDAVIPLHNENSYQRDWPTRIVFTCMQPADVGGETTLAWTGGVTAGIDDDVIRRFSETGVMYVRNYGHGIDLP